MASWKWPALVNKILSDVPGVNVLLNALLKQDPAGTTDIPAGAKRWADGADGKQFQVFNGSTWESAGKLDHDVASVDGKSVSVSVVPDTIPVRDASGKIPGDITGNAATATEASALSEVNPIEMGGTGGATAAEARLKLGVPPTDHASAGMDFGIGTGAKYGHLQTHDEPDATLTAASGHAFSPAGAAAMQEALGGLLGETQGAVSELDASLRALIAEEVAKCLKTSGGDIRYLNFVNDAQGGGFIFATDNIFYVGGRGSDGRDASFVRLFSLNNPDAPGAFTLVTRNANGDWGPNLHGERNGSLWWNNHHVFTSAGGDMTGEIRVNNVADFIRRTVNNDRLVILGGPHWESCAYFELFGGDNTGRAQLNARDGINCSHLVLYPDGRANINNNAIVTLVSSWFNGYNWVRKYSNGWIEQGGFAPMPAKDTRVVTVNLHTPFTTGNTYCPQITLFRNFDSDEHWASVGNRTTTSFNVHSRWLAAGTGFFWTAFGY